MYHFLMLLFKKKMNMTVERSFLIAVVYYTTIFPYDLCKLFAMKQHVFRHLNEMYCFYGYATGVQYHSSERDVLCCFSR